MCHTLLPAAPSVKWRASLPLKVARRIHSGALKQRTNLNESEGTSSSLTNMGGSPERRNRDAKRYCWPASALGEEEMRQLYAEKRRTGKPITVLIRDAVIRSLPQKVECDEHATV